MPDGDPRADYPLGARRPDLVKTPTGLSLADLTVDRLRDGRLRGEDMRATPATLLHQARVARASGRAQLAEGLERAAELTSVPDEVILEIYTALRPGRSTAAELEACAGLLEREYGAGRVAAFVREASHAYASRSLLAVRGAE